uniref:Uncharacterized protein n=1 Tax=Arundo donax TaxID=35708 RepID=A0A0A9C532_ARUDO
MLMCNCKGVGQVFGLRDVYVTCLVR